MDSGVPFRVAEYRHRGPCTMAMQANSQVRLRNSYTPGCDSRNPHQILAHQVKRPRFALPIPIARDSRAGVAGRPWGGGAGCIDRVGIAFAYSFDRATCRRRISKPIFAMVIFPYARRLRIRFAWSRLFCHCVRIARSPFSCLCAHPLDQRASGANGFIRSPETGRGARADRALDAIGHGADLASGLLRQARR